MDISVPGLPKMTNPNRRLCVTYKCGNACLDDWTGWVQRWLLRARCISIIVIFASVLCAQPSVYIHSPCSVVSKCSSVQGKLITIKGSYGFSPHGRTLYSDSCDLRDAKGRQIPPTVDLAFESPKRIDVQSESASEMTK